MLCLLVVTRQSRPLRPLLLRHCDLWLFPSSSSRPQLVLGMILGMSWDCYWVNGVVGLACKYVQSTPLWQSLFLKNLHTGACHSGHFSPFLQLPFRYQAHDLGFSGLDDHSRPLPGDEERLSPILPFALVVFAFSFTYAFAFAFALG